MKVERHNAKDPTPEEVRELEKLKAMLDRAMADGVITHEEFRSLVDEVFAHGKPSADLLSRALELYRTMVTEKVQRGELIGEWENLPGI
jgi:polyhydroxyalkanoate synthesis regulator phasin